MSQRTIVILSFCLFVLALLWGGFTFLVYLGIPIHQLVYSSAGDINSLDLACGTQPTISMYLCRGSAAIVPFVGAVFNMSSPFFAYLIVWAVLFGAALLFAGYQTGYFRLRMTVRPLYLVSLFVFSVWLMATTLSLGTFYNLNTPKEAMVTEIDGSKAYPPFRRFYEPVPQVYTGAGPQAIAELKANYDSLLARGCLTEAGVTQNGARVYDLGIWCIQGSIFSRVGIQLFLVGYLLLVFLSLGRAIFRLLVRKEEIHPLLECVLSLGLGALGMVAILWTLAVFGLLKPSFIRLLFFGLPAVLFPQTWYWLKSAWTRTFETELSANSFFPLLTWLLLSYLALNFLNVVRPFPIGWDDLGSYLNRPRLLASYGAFIPSMSQFQWEYLTALGYLLFGYDSWTGSTFAMQINWSAGLLSVLTVYAFGRLFFGERRGILAAILYYFLPMTGHFSFADMKVDNASFFTSALSLLAVFALLLLPDEKEGDGKGKGRRSMLLVAAGLLAGFSFAIKPTAVLAILMALSVIAGAGLGSYGFAGLVALGFAVLQRFGSLDIASVARRALLGWMPSQDMVLAATALLGVVLLVVGMVRHRCAIRAFGLHFALFALGMAISALPWMMHNAVVSRSFSVSGMLSARDFTAPQVSYEQKPTEALSAGFPVTPIRYLPPELKLDVNSPACKTSARVEELDRYWGFDRGFKHYLTLPWRQVMNIDSFGYYVTLIPLLLLFPLVLLLPVFWMRKGRWLRLLFAGTFIFFLQWSLVANGIPWYGIGMFLGFALAFEAFIVYAPDAPNRFLFGTLIGASILICLVNRFWQFDTQKNLFEYPLGKITAGALREVTIPDYDDIRESVVSRHETMPDTPYTYRVGTFISYFIPRNREIFPLADHQLNFFNCLNQERDQALTLRRLKALGFNSIIFDTNTQTIEKDPNGSLHKKVNAFLEFANDPVLKLTIQINDPGNGIAYLLLP
ncbi:MAG: hypothetical protein WC840_02010 [Candidatus Peribacteraceae bacterium]